MNGINEYGKLCENPVKLNSLSASVIFMNNLVTVNGLYLIYHRKESIYSSGKVVDHYEIMVSNNQFDDLYISIYNTQSVWIPPAGYLFISYSEDMNRQLMEREKLDKLDEADVIRFDEKYIFFEPLPIDLGNFAETNQSLPSLERVLLDSYGKITRMEHFPYGLILELLNRLMIKEYGLLREEMDQILACVEPRKIDDSK